MHCRVSLAGDCRNHLPSMAATAQLSAVRDLDAPPSDVWLGSTKFPLGSELRKVSRASVRK